MRPRRLGLAALVAAVLLASPVAGFLIGEVAFADPEPANLELQGATLASTTLEDRTPRSLADGPEAHQTVVTSAPTPTTEQPPNNPVSTAPATQAVPQAGSGGAPTTEPDPTTTEAPTTTTAAQDTTTTRPPADTTYPPGTAEPVPGG